MDQMQNQQRLTDRGARWTRIDQAKHTIKLIFHVDKDACSILKDEHNSKIDLPSFYLL